MNTYKGLKVPDAIESEKYTSTSKDRQDFQCELRCNVDNNFCEDIDCDECLFFIKNIEFFEQWEKEKNLTD